MRASPRARRAHAIPFATRGLPTATAVALRNARLADEQLRAGRKPRRHDTWIAATALRHGAAVVTQDADFSDFSAVQIILV